MEESILTAAEELFLARGFTATSTTDIAKKAGCNQALVHYYFRTKDRLFEAIFARKMAAFGSELLRISAENLDFEEKIRRKVTSHFQMVANNPRLPLLLFSELHSNPARLNSLEAHIQQVPRAAYNAFRDELEQEIRAGNARPMRIEDLLLSIISLNVMPFLARPFLQLLSRMSPEQYDTLLEERLEENIRIILNSLKP